MTGRRSGSKTSLPTRSRTKSSHRRHLGESLDSEERVRLFRDVFNPRPGEKALFLVDQPHEDVEDNSVWKQRREMAEKWCEDFQRVDGSLEVGMLRYPATGLNNAPIPDEVIEEAKQSDIVIAMTEFSATTSMKPICEEGNVRAASMPHVSPEMEETALAADYTKVREYAFALKELLDKAVTAEIEFSTGHELTVDLKNRESSADTGDFTEPGATGNFPAGETYIVPYEGEDRSLGKSTTQGIWPAQYGDELVLYQVEDNRIVEVRGEGPEADEMRDFFEEEESRRNIAELGIGCNPEAVVGSGLVIEEEKAGPHVAYGKSAHFRDGTVESDVHQDIVYASGCDITATVTLEFGDGEEVIVREGETLYEKL